MSGAELLANYEGAPEEVKARFDSRLKARVRYLSDSERFLCESLDDDPVPPRRPLPVVADVNWRFWTPRSDTRKDIENMNLRELWPVLTGQDVPRNGMVLCPAHEESNPSCSVRDERWKCFACGAGGTLIDLGAVVWEIEPRGQGFHEIREKLLSL